MTFYSNQVKLTTALREQVSQISCDLSSMTTPQLHFFPHAVNKVPPKSLLVLREGEQGRVGGLAQGSTRDITRQISHPGATACQADTNINTPSGAHL